MNVRYHELARQEVIEITQYYASERSELAAEFLAELASGVDAIVSNASTYEQVRPGLRRYLLQRFPYSIYYRQPDAETIRIVAVKHHSRRPGYGMRRT
jgi:toxin ParE1/3/4